MAMSAGAIRAAQAFVEILADDSQARRVLKQFQTRMEGWATSMNQLGRAMFLPALGFGLAMQRTTKVFADFEQEMSKVKARLDAADAGFESLSKKAIELGKTTAFSATQAASAMTKFAEAGYDSARIATIMGPAINLAAAGMMELGEAADVIVTTLNAFNLNADQIPHVVDMLASASVESASDVRELSQAFVYASTVASVAGVPLQDLVGVLSLLHDSGIKADIAGTSVRGMILSLTSPSEKAAQAMRMLGVQVQDMRGNMLPLATIVEQFRRATAGMGSAQRLKFIGEIFDTRQASAFAKLVDLGANKINARTELIYNDHGRAAEVARVQMDNLAGDFRRLMGTFEAFQITLTKAVVEPLRTFSVSLKTVIGVMDEWAKQNPELVRVLAAIGVALTIAAPALIAFSIALKLAAFAFQPIFLAMTVLGRGVPLMVGAFRMMGGLVGLLVPLIAGRLVGAFRLLAVVMTTSVTVAARVAFMALARVWLAARVLMAKATVVLVRTVLMAAIQGVTALVPLVVSAFTAMGSAIAFLIANPISLLVVALVGIGVAIVYASGAWGRAVATMKNAWSNFTGSAMKAWKLIVDALSAGRFDLAFRAVCVLMKIAWLEMVDFFMTNWEEFRDFVIDTWDEAQTNFAIGVTRFTDAMVGGISAIKQAWEEFFEWLSGKNDELRKNAPLPGERPGAGGGGRFGDEGGHVDAGGVGFGGGVAGMAVGMVAKAAIGVASREMFINRKRMELEGVGDPERMQEFRRNRRGNATVNGPNIGGWRIVPQQGDDPPVRETAQSTAMAGARERSRAASQEAERLQKKAEGVQSRFEGGKATATDVAWANYRARRAKTVAEKRRAIFEKLANKKGSRLMIGPGLTDEQKKSLGIPVGEGAPAEETPKPASLLAAEEAVNQAKQKRDAAGTPEEQLIADKELRHAERVQAREQRKFDTQKKRAGFNRELDSAKEEAEQLLNNGGKNVGLGQRFGGMFGDMLSGAKASVQGSFSAHAVAGLGAGNNQLSRIASFSEQTAKNTKDIKNKEGAFV